MGQVESSMMEPPVQLQGFLNVSVSYLEKLVYFIKSDPEGSFVITKWKLLEFTGTERLTDVSLLFSLYDRGKQETYLSGLHVCCALILLNTRITTKEKILCLLTLFDWNNQGRALGFFDVLLGLQLCGQSLEETFEKHVVDASDIHQLTKLCHSAFPSAERSATFSQLTDWCLKDMHLRTILTALTPSEVQSRSSGGAPREPNFGIRKEQPEDTRTEKLSVAEKQSDTRIANLAKDIKTLELATTSGPPNVEELEVLAQLAFRNKVDLLRSNLTQMYTEQSVLKMYNTVSLHGDLDFIFEGTSLDDKGVPTQALSKWTMEKENSDGYNTPISRLSITGRRENHRWNPLVNRLGNLQTVREVNATLNSAFSFPAAVVPMDQQHSQSKYLKRMIRRGLSFMESCLDEITAEVRSRKNDDIYSCVYSEYKSMFSQLILEAEAELDVCTDAHYSHGGPFANVFRLFQAEAAYADTNQDELRDFLTRETHGVTPDDQPDASANTAVDPFSIAPQNLLGYMVNNLTKVCTKHDIRARISMEMDGIDKKLTRAPTAEPDDDDEDYDSELEASSPRGAQSQYGATPFSTRLGIVRRFSVSGMHEWDHSFFTALYFARKFQFSPVMFHVESKVNEALEAEQAYLESLEIQSSQNMGASSKKRPQLGRVLEKIGKRMGIVHQHLYNVFFATRHIPQRNLVGGTILKTSTTISKRVFPEGYWFLRDYFTLRIAHQRMMEYRYGIGGADHGDISGLNTPIRSQSKTGDSPTSTVKHQHAREVIAKQSLLQDPKKFLQVLAHSSTIWSDPSVLFANTNVTKVPKDLLNPLIQTHAYSFITQKLRDDAAKKIIGVKSARSFIKVLLRWSKDSSETQNASANWNSGSFGFGPPQSIAETSAEVASHVLSIRVDTTLNQIKNMSVESTFRRRNLLAWEFIYEFIKTGTVKEEEVVDNEEDEEEDGGEQPGGEDGKKPPGGGPAGREDSKKKDGNFGKELSASAKKKKKKTINIQVDDKVVKTKLNDLQNFFFSNPSAKDLFGDVRDCVWFSARETVYDLTAPLSADGDTAVSASSRIEKLMQVNADSGNPIEIMEKFLDDHKILIPSRSYWNYTDAISFVDESELTLGHYIQSRFQDKICTFDLDDIRQAFDQVNSAAKLHAERTDAMVSRADIACDQQIRWTMMHGIQLAYLDRLEEYVGTVLSSKNCNMRPLARALGPYASSGQRSYVMKSAAIRQRGGGGGGIRLSGCENNNMGAAKSLKKPRYEHTFPPLPTFSFAIGLNSVMGNDVSENARLPPDPDVAIIPEVVGQFIGAELVRINLCPTNPPVAQMDVSGTETMSSGNHHIRQRPSKQASVVDPAAAKGVYVAKKLGLARSLQYYAERRFSRILLCRGFRKFDLHECNRFSRQFSHIRELLDDICEARKRKHIGATEMVDLSELLVPKWELAAGVRPKGVKSHLFEGIADAHYKELSSSVWSLLSPEAMPGMFPVVCFLFIEAKHQRSFYGGKLAAKARIVSSFFRIILKQLTLQYQMSVMQENIQYACHSSLHYLTYMLNGSSKVLNRIERDRVEEMKEVSASLQTGAFGAGVGGGGAQPGRGADSKDQARKPSMTPADQAIHAYVSTLCDNVGCPSNIQICDIEILEGELRSKMKLIDEERERRDFHDFSSRRFLCTEQRKDVMQIRGIQLALFHLKMLLSS